MYRVEVATGEEAVFRTIDELATGIRNGLITPRSRIYHAASQKWLPIEFHPHYKKALQQVTGGAPMLDLGPTEPSRPPRRSNPGVRAPESAPPPPPASVPPVRAEPSRADRVWPEPPRAFASPVEVPAPRAEPPKIEAPRTELPRPQPPRAEAPRAEVGRADLRAPAPALAEPLPVARRRTGHRGSFIIGAVAALALGGGYLVTSVLPGTKPAAAESSVHPGESSTPAPAEPEESPAVQEEPAPAPALPPTVTALEPAPRPAGPVSQAWSSSAGAIAPPPTPLKPAPAPASSAEAPAAIAPPPGELDLSLPRLPLAESLAGAGRAPHDSGAIKRILRAVTKPAAGFSQ